MTIRKPIKWFILGVILTVLVYYFYPEKRMVDNAKISKIVINKSERKMMVYDGNDLLNTYSISLGASPVGEKQSEGDNKTPEGHYSVEAKLGLGVSKYHKALRVSYPSPAQKKMGKSGSNIMIHGLGPKYHYFGKFHRFYDWTQGCIAVTDDEIDQIYKATKVGVAIIINP
jgi:murein L,D-transpeptidase YafK